MNDEERAKEELRREVGYGCPVCRSPFLEFHHFDPPQYKETHWRPEGMIAMCRECHPDADEKEAKGAGAYSPDELRQMKKKGYSTEDVKGRFPSWRKKNILVRMGGCYTTANGPVLSVSGAPQIFMTRNEADLLCLSFELRNSDEVVAARMEANSFTVRPHKVQDMTVKAKLKDVKIWLEKEDVGLALSFKRITIEDLQRMLADDCKNAYATLEQRERKRIDQLAAEARADLLEMHEAMFGRPVNPADNFIAMKVQEWVKANCDMGDGLVPVMNFEQMAIHFHGHRISIKDGVGDMFFYCFAETRNGFNLKCPCHRCIDIPGSI